MSGEPLLLLLDSTGLKLCGAGEWLREKRGTKTRRSWRKLHIDLDVDTGQIAAAARTAEEVDANRNGNASPVRQHHGTTSMRPHPIRSLRC